MARDRNRSRLKIGRRVLEVGNLTKKMYPSGFTKADVLDYYLQIAPVLLPHFRDRPVALKRFPDGVGRQSFWEKDVPRYAPSWIKTAPVWRVSGESQIHYIVIANVETLAWLASIAALELHPFLHRAAHVHRPTSVVFDLDPGPGAGILRCAEVAFLLRQRLQTWDLESYVKVSGSKGLQLYVPLNTAVTYDRTQTFARVLAEELAAAHPSLVVAQMAKALRTGKVFIDWSQNATHKTTVGVYSLRAKRASERPYVSLPITWHELELASKRRDGERLCWEPDAAVKRVRKMGDLFKPVLAVKQRLPPRVAAPHGPPEGGPHVRIRRESTVHAPRAAAASAVAAPKSRKRRSTLPEFVPPMLAEQHATVPRGPEWVYELKLDGYRVEAAKAGSVVRLYSRKGNNLTADYPEVVRAVAGINADSVLLDGEIVALDAQGRPSFQALQHRSTKTHPVVYYAFDLLECDGRDVRRQPLDARRLELAKVLKGSRVHLSETFDGDPDEIVAAIKRLQLEGLIAKRRTSLYSSRRAADWIKVKFLRRQEFVVAGYKPGFDNFESLIVGYYEDGKLWFAGKVRNGFTPALRAQLWRKLEPLNSETNPFADKPTRTRSHWGEGLTTEDLQTLRWLNPVVVAEVGFVEWTRDKHLRHSTFVGLRPDKDAGDVVREES